MKLTKKSTAGTLTRSNTALAIFAATLLVGGTATEASAKSRHHHHRYHHHHASASEGSSGSSSNSSSNSSWRDANASIGATGGHSFTGVASMYGNESGSQTASGQRFNENAMTCAHRSLPFGTKLRVTHGGRSVVVTVNDRGPFVKGRVLDLSTGAARALGLSGIGQVTAEVMG
jgi:rare lipoprotein A